MVQADVIVGEISCQQKIFLAHFFELNFTLAVTNGYYYPTFELGFLNDFEICNLITTEKATFQREKCLTML